MTSEPFSDLAPGPALDASELKGKRGLRRVINAAGYSIDGLVAAWRDEDAFRQECLAALVLVPAALLLPVSLLERVLLVGVVLIVLIVELLNTAIEATVDRDSTAIDPLGKRAKDLGSAAVMLSIVLAAGTWIAILARLFG